MKIHQFNPILYPVRLWIVITKDGESLKGDFVYCDTREEIDVSIFKTSEAITYHVVQRNSPWYKGVLVVFGDKKCMTTKNIAHESAHVADIIWKHISERAYGEEANAYLVGWVAECMEEVKKCKNGQAS